MREFRFLEEKRKLAPLTQAEEQRWIELGRTLGIFDPAEPNADDVAEADPNDIVLVEPGLEEADPAWAAGPVDGHQSVPLAKNVESVQPVAASVDSTAPQADPSPAQAASTSWDLPASDGLVAQSASAPETLKEDGQPLVEPAGRAPLDTAADEGDTWSGADGPR